MIQRIQSVYLALVAFFTLFLLKGGLINFTNDSGKTLRLMLSGSISGEGGVTVATVRIMWPFLLIVILTALVSLIAIFLFKKRNIQLILAKLLVIFSVLVASGCLAYILYVNNNFGLKVVPGIGLFFPVLIILFAVLALRGIVKDEHLVRSYDRLR
jgi:hypothetical protein